MLPSLDVPEIDPGTLGCLPDLPDVSALDPQRVEIRRVGLTQAGRRQGCLEGLREPVNALANRAKALGAVIHRVHRGHVGKERLRRADVGRGFLATNVLLAGLERHAVGALAARVHRHTDDPPRRLPNEGVTRGKERGMRSAVAERDAESLRVPDDRVGAHFAGRHEQRERHQIGRDRDEDTGGSRLFDDRTEIADGTVVIRILNEQAERAIHRQRVDVADLERDIERFRAPLEDVDRLREDDDPTRETRSAALPAPSWC